ncbi:right-handed parallel beta-helix repeat-containing protein [Cellulomonas persica]|uniref:Right handed beta helix domain-containing protein n=1 Tax=Cellulomonas persica TaxID=76861 RepID=A0A510V1S5_9CELL|nr:right-handed parallel beta-helix repeat-containing protein [Cellulomonas persica]GEK19055.1 hypothetical protein CPE01_27880 [Cellulomonas persica]
MIGQRALSTVATVVGALILGMVAGGVASAQVTLEQSASPLEPVVAARPTPAPGAAGAGSAPRQGGSPAGSSATGTFGGSGTIGAAGTGGSAAAVCLAGFWRCNGVDRPISRNRPGITTPAPSPSATPTASASPTSSPTPRPSASPTPTRSPSPSASPTPTKPPTTAPPSSGRPGPDNTGVPTGTKLSVVEGDVKVTEPNTVISGKEIRGIVWVQAPGTVIRNSVINGRAVSSSLALVMVQSGGSVTIEDSELYARIPSPYLRGIIGSDFTLTRVDIHTVTDQLMLTDGDVLVQDSWLHDNVRFEKDPNQGGATTHDDNVQISKGDNIKLLRNTFSGSSSASLMVTQDQGAVSNLVLSGNHISDGGCAVNLAEKGYGTISPTTLTNNVFTRTQIHSGCAIIADQGTLNALTISGNTWSDGTAVKARPRS